jgi:hypothetical protein
VLFFRIRLFLPFWLIAAAIFKRNTLCNVEECGGSSEQGVQMKTFQMVSAFTAIACIGAFAPSVIAQIAPAATYFAGSENLPSRNAGLPPNNGSVGSSDTALPAPGTTQPEPDLTYSRPTEKEKLHSYFFDAFGPYPLAGAVAFGALNQATKTPPEWGQGMGAYGERVGSVFGIALVTTTTRYTLAKAFREDTLYYRCECTGVMRRLGHAMISTVTSRIGDDGHRRLSFPAIVSPYAGSMTAVYGWYPSRYGAKDGFRMGNYAILAFAAGNIAREFIYGGPHTLFGHMGHSSTANTSTDSNP